MKEDNYQREEKKISETAGEGKKKMVSYFYLLYTCVLCCCVGACMRIYS